MTREPTEIELLVEAAICEIWTGCDDDPPSTIDMARAALRSLRTPPFNLIDTVASKIGVQRSLVGLIVMELVDAASPGEG